jgi:hypothetical protein
MILSVRYQTGSEHRVEILVMKSNVCLVICGLVNNDESTYMNDILRQENKERIFQTHPSLTKHFFDFSVTNCRCNYLMSDVNFINF